MVNAKLKDLREIPSEGCDDLTFLRRIYIDRTGSLPPLERVQSFPDVPTVAEAGVPGFELINWYGLFAPAKTPSVIVDALQAEIARALGSTEVQAAFAKDGAEATPSASPRQFAALLDKELESWQKLVKLPGFAENLK